jgi:hypothetical protein
VTAVDIQDLSTWRKNTFDSALLEGRIGLFDTIATRVVRVDRLLLTESYPVGITAEGAIGLPNLFLVLGLVEI